MADGVFFALIALTGLVLPLAQAVFITGQKYRCADGATLCLC